ncbi:MAG: hypothetical protein ACOCQ1_03970 [Halanaerobiaceae bacterium]
MKVEYKKEELKAVKTYACCSECGQKLEYTGHIHYTTPVVYPHVCKNCGQRVNLKKRYPIVEIREEN